ncbi:MAG: ABC transporter permease [Acidobacteria bacterium]|nr:MAG: ABC transporter permease [Acidobacteriota bacterium]
MRALWQDVRYGLRMLAKSPGFSALVILTLALGIGANTAIFSVVNAVLLRPLPFEEPDRLMQIWHTPPQASFPGIPTFTVSPANFLDWRARSQAFEGMSAYGFGQYTLTGTGHPEAVRMVAVTSGFFSILRAKPLLGRAFLTEEDSPGREHEVVLSYNLWRSRFGADRDIVGKNIALNEQAFTVIGVMGPNFEFPISTDPNYSPQMWKPLAWTDQERAIRDNHNYAVVARLKDGVTLQQARAELDSVSNQLAQQYPGDDKGWGATAIPLREDLVGDVRPALLILLGTVALVLLIACANVANLLLAKAMSRRKEIAIRVAMGASRPRLLQQGISETVLMALAGGALGLLFAHYGVMLIVRFLAQRLPRSTEIGLDGWVFTFALGISLLTGIAVGLVSSLRFAKNDVSESLKQGLGRTSSDSGGTRTRNILVVSEVALSLMLLIGAGLLIRSLSVLRHVNPGFDASRLLTLEVAIPSTKFSEPMQQVRYFDRVLDQVRGLPGVQSAGVIDSLPLSGGSHQPVSVEGRPIVPMADQPEVDVRLISPGYISAMHIALLSGRDIDQSDVQGRPGAVLISQSFAKLFWPNENPIGKHLTLYFFRDLPRVVVGVVADVKLDALNETRPTPALYTPLAQVAPTTGGTWRSFGLNLAVRTNVDPLNVASMVTNSIREVDAEVPLLNIQTMEESVSASLSPQRFTMLLLVAFAGTALLLAAAGIYGVMAYMVTRRTREIGVRMALGADASDVLRLVIGQGMWTTAIGVAIGIGGAFALTRTMQSLLFGVSTTDPMTLAGVVLLLAAVSAFACWVPARRATKVDPLVALRYE